MLTDRTVAIISKYIIVSNHHIVYLKLTQYDVNYISVKLGKGTSLVVQWLRLRASTTGGTGLLPGQGTKIPHAAWYKIGRASCRERV